jgi:hypothetical protein
MARPQCDTPLVHITLVHQMVVLWPLYNVIGIQWYANIKLKMLKSPFIKVSQTVGISYWDAILKGIEFVTLYDHIELHSFQTISIS